MGKCPQGITDTRKKLYQNLLEQTSSVPEDTMFQDGLFDSPCEALQDRNEVSVIRDVSLLLFPSAESLAIRGCKQLRCLIENVDDGTTASLLHQNRPSPIMRWESAEKPSPKNNCRNCSRPWTTSLTGLSSWASPTRTFRSSPVKSNVERRHSTSLPNRMLTV